MRDTAQRNIRLCKSAFLQGKATIRSFCKNVHANFVIVEKKIGFFVWLS